MMSKPLDADTTKEFRQMCSALAKSPHMELVDKRTTNDYRIRTYQNSVTNEYKTVRYIKPKYRK